MRRQLHTLRLQLSFDPMLWSEAELIDVHFLPLVNSKHVAIGILPPKAVKHLLGAGEVCIHSDVQACDDIILG